MTDFKSQIEIIRQGTVQVVDEKELEQKLMLAQKEKRSLRVKYGADPSAPDIHLGHTVPIRKLRQFQDLGHEVIFIIGDFTAMIGDPTGRSETRKPLSLEAIEKNAETYKQQIFKILDPQKTKVVYNSHWLGKLNLRDIVGLTAKYTVAQLLERDDFLKRYKAGHPISLVEFLYPLMQGYDSVELKADIELGGTDQTFNLLVSREIQRAYGQEPEVVITMPILEGTDGVNKMSKSLGNYIGVSEAPKEMFGKIMSISDNLMWKYYELLLQCNKNQLDEYKKLHPMDMKKQLARSIVKQYWNEGDAENAQKEFENVFSKRQNPDEIPDVSVSGSIGIIELVRKTGAVTSNGEAKRIVQQGGVEIDGNKITDMSLNFEPKNGSVIKIGKRNFYKIKTC
jgi:tyrosyl-tRNA synthetase